MTDFKVGSKVLVNDSYLEELEDYTSKGRVHVIIKEKDIDGDYLLSNGLDELDDYFYANDKQIVPQVKDFSTLEQGDILLFNEGRDRYTFQGYVGDILFYTSEGGANVYNDSLEHISDGEVVIEDNAKEELTELTLEEVAEKLNVPVKQLRIKD